jgi:anti-sigma-K factor RskA
MTHKEIQESGLLELYAIDEITPVERDIVNKALSQSAELREELSSIESSLMKYAQLLSVKPSTDLKSKILSKLTSETVKSVSEDNSKKGAPSLFSWLLLLSCIGLAAAYFMSQNKYQELKDQHEKSVIVCDSITQAKNVKIALLENIQNKNNRIIELKATEKYPETELYFHYNPVLKKNYIQVKNLPHLASNQSYQLWALKGKKQPIPLDVFENNRDNIFEVKFVDAPDAYAITIEPKGGKESPTLEDLIGTVGITG